MPEWEMLLMRWGFSLPFAAMGLYLVIVAARLFVQRRDWKLRAIAAEGTIVAFEHKSPSGSGADRPYIAPVVTFTTPSGEIRFTSATATRPNPYSVGQRVAVRYLPEDPEGADLESSASSWMSLVVVLILAIVALTVATLPFVLAPPAPHR
jgi:hypothetical protein